MKAYKEYCMVDKVRCLLCNAELDVKQAKACIKLHFGLSLPLPDELGLRGDAYRLLRKIIKEGRS